MEVLWQYTEALRQNRTLSVKVKSYFTNPQKGVKCCFSCYPRKMRNMMRKNRKRNRKKYFCSETLSSRSSQSFSNTNEPNNLSLDQNLLVGVSSQLYEGQLSKYTNMMKAIISPSDEDSNTFTVSSVCGNCLKLRARDARGRRDWITKLRTVAQHHGDSTREKVFQRSSLKSEIDETKEAFDKVKKHLFETEKERLLLTKAIDDLPTRGKLHHLDPDFLTLKALSYAVVVSLNQCLFILQEQPHRSEL
ncbi:oxysterol-binding protein-related protein 11 [Halyomorpha halys]|uniref:oxysterol-binding protein-related protein 11 n=1 Tax=Halyomorpha halys TaxID=286706 RepID=UPI0006D524EF|nr:oxysterol-binding protein-related protein 11-like isoform X3 [Halyomorpha halys]